MLVKIKSDEEIQKAKSLIPVQEGMARLTPDQLVSERFRRFFLSYAQAINKQEQRKGSLFMKPFKRIPINTQKYLINTLLYIHTNPEYHNNSVSFKTYKWSSFQSILNDCPSQLRKNEVIDWFDGKENYLFCHNKQIVDKILKKIILE